MKSNKPTTVRFFFLLVVLAVLGAVGLFWWRDAIAAADPADRTPMTFVVKRGEGVKSIAARLAADGLIRSPTGFYLLVKMMRIDGDLQAGDFRLNPAMEATAIARELTHGTLDVWVTTIEGWRVEEVAAKLTKELDIPESEFVKVAREGYMFPDTYLMPRDATAGAVADLFFTTFDRKVDEKLRSDAKKTGLSFDDVMTLSSIVEREGRTDEDRPVIAGILLKRLANDWPLQADATLQYALGYQGGEKSWWKKGLTEEDKKVRSPYNTYGNTGLPPRPIANPGLASIKAVIYPKETDYWYYLHAPDGSVYYAKTLEEHERNIAKHLR